MGPRWAQVQRQEQRQAGPEPDLKDKGLSSLEGTAFQKDTSVWAEFGVLPGERRTSPIRHLGISGSDGFGSR